MKFQLRTYYIVFLAIIVQSTSVGQSEYIGLENESDISTIQQTIAQYWPKSQIIENYIYVSTPQGIYRKELSNLENIIWESFAFYDVPIRDFIKKGNEILANTAYGGFDNEIDSLLIYSNDNGLSYDYLDSSHFVQPSSFNTMYRIAQNPQNNNEILALHHQGVSKSVDFGTTWSNSHIYAPEYQYRFLGYHPLDIATIFYTGETGFFSSYLQISYNSGLSWENTDSVENNCTHYIAFHPENQNTILSAGEGRITKSNDKGLSWNSSVFLTPYIYVNKIIYDESNPDIVYAVGIINGNNDTIYILRSTDGGDNWGIAHQEALVDSGGIIDFHIYENIFILITAFKGVFTLDSSVLSIPEIIGDSTIYIYPNPASTAITCKSDKQIEKIEIYDINGKMINAIQQNSNSFVINISSFAKGVYIFKLYSYEITIIKKVIKM